MIINGEMERMWVDVVVGYFKVVIKNLRGDEDGLQDGVHFFHIHHM
jgi:hypothetical protein